MHFDREPNWLNWADGLVENAKRPLGLQSLQVVDFAGVKFGENEQFESSVPLFVTVTTQSLAIYRHYREEHPLLRGQVRYASTARFGGTARATGCHGAYVVTNVIIWRGRQFVIGELSVYPLSDGDHRIGLSPLPKEQQDAFMVTREGDLTLRP
ncbi:MAG TPA: hypothetical protein VLG09_00795 [Candidatus Saccharimonadales bacterium]|nr:hypothetical protein [Candidatus Saccharimonadales bacterium]